MLTADSPDCPKAVPEGVPVSVKPFPVIHKEFLSDGISTRQVPALGFKFKYNGILKKIR
jgi:hypothetical protein